MKKYPEYMIVHTLDKLNSLTLHQRQKYYISRKKRIRLKMNQTDKWRIRDIMMDHSFTEPKEKKKRLHF